MPVFSKNKQIQSLLDNLIDTYETEINYTPIEKKIDFELDENDIKDLHSFVSQSRKRLFVFKLANKEDADKLAFSARRSFLNQTAATILQHTSGEPKINPLKKDLNTPPQTVRAGIQIQKSFTLPKQSAAPKIKENEQIKQEVVLDLVLLPIENQNLDDIAVLKDQLKLLSIQNIHDAALQKIREHLDAFTDGIIPSNLPKGFYIDSAKSALCYTSDPRRLPSALAPVLEKSNPLEIPTKEQVKVLLPTTPGTIIDALMNDENQGAQKDALISLFPTHTKEINTFFTSLKPAELDFIVPFLAKQFILGGEAHTRLFIQLLKVSNTKKVSIEFLKDPEAQNAFLTPRGIKNFQKLIQLPAEQREWWNSLANSHIKNAHHRFDFNVFFEGYTQIFLPAIAEKNLSLPLLPGNTEKNLPPTCPIVHQGHFLVTLNRVLDVLNNAQNPQEQCLNLQGLNWSPTGVHYAMTQAPEANRFKQVAACMKLESSKDTELNLELIYQQINANAQFDLNSWLFRYIGQHWKKEIRLTDIQAQFDEIQNTPGWSPVQKNQLAFILACGFSDESPLKVENWKQALKSTISLLQQLGENDRNDLINALSRSFNFIPVPSFAQIQELVELCLELKNTFQALNFKDDLLLPLTSCLENEGFALINTLQARIQKIDQTPTARKATLDTIVSFTKLLHKNRLALSSNTIKLLAALNEPTLAQENAQQTVDKLHLAIQNFRNGKNQQYCDLLFGLLGQINISKSQTLPNAENIHTLLTTLDKLPHVIPQEHKTLEQQEEWLKDQLLDQLPGCVLGTGTISKLDDLIVEALVEGVKKRAAVLDIAQIKRDLVEKLKKAPAQLVEQLNKHLIPLLDSLDKLVTSLQMPNPQFEKIIETFKLFDQAKDILLEADLNTGIGTAKGKHLLNLILTGTKHKDDETTGFPLKLLLMPLHHLLVKEINAWFSKEENRKQVKDLDAPTVLKWFTKFNDTHSIIFLFEEELVQKKVLPALRKTLLQLNTQNKNFDDSILTSAEELAQDLPSSIALTNYKAKVESIAGYLNLLIDIKVRSPEEFSKIFTKLNDGGLAHLKPTHKKDLLDILKSTGSLETYLTLADSVFKDSKEANEEAISRAIKGLQELFKLDLDADTKKMFFKMSVAHNLKSASPFPISILNDLKNSPLDEEKKSLIIKEIINILSNTTNNDSADSIRGLIQDTQTFLTDNKEYASLCIALLKRIPLQGSSRNLGRDLGTYSNILSEISAPSKEIGQKENIDKLVKILTGLAKSLKDDSVNLATLLEIAKGLKRRPALNLEQVTKLFVTPPYPNAQRLNLALADHGNEKLEAYCKSFDTNPFAKSGETRDLKQQFATDRVNEALINLKDLLNGVALPHALQLQLAKQLTYIETLGYTDPLNPHDYKDLKQLTKSSRKDLKKRARSILLQFREHTVAEDQVELLQLELLANLREIYFRSTGLFPNSTQMLVLLLSLQTTDTNLLMSIKTGEGKSLITAMFAVLQWAQGGTVDVCTANKTLLERDYENSCEPFFKFLKINSSVIQANSKPEDYQLNGINCSTVEDMSLFRLSSKESKDELYLKEKEYIKEGGVIHLILDECDDALLDQTTLYKLVAEQLSSEKSDNPAQWIYPLAYDFINLPEFRNIGDGKWDEEEDLDRFRLFINKIIATEFNGDVNKLNFIMAASNTQLRQWIYASCRAATLIENKHFVVRTIKLKTEEGNEITRDVCVPLAKSTPKDGCIFTDGVHQALQARLMAQTKDKPTKYFFDINEDPPVLASQSARGLVRFYQDTKGRIVGISGTPGDSVELQYLSTVLGTQAIGVAPHAGDKRVKHEPIFTFSDKETMNAIYKAIDSIKLPVTKAFFEIDDNQPLSTNEDRENLVLDVQNAKREWNKTQTQPILLVAEDFDEAKKIGDALLARYKNEKRKVQVVTGKENKEELEQIIKEAGKANVITVGTAMLARGIDINPGDHPKGLFVIQAYPDSKRISTQIGGRAARNGKPGQWLPIYQIEPPENWFKKIMYFIFPWYRQSHAKEDIKKLQIEIKLQANIDRLYTQAIDQAQQVLLQQVQAWESLLIALYPEDGNIRHDLYKWREKLLKELTQAQETSVTQDTLESSIAQFENAVCKIWESAKEEKWVAKAQKATEITAEQTLRLNYLKQLDLSQELKVQRALEKKAPPLKAATKALVHQNLEAVILDKAGAVLEYTKPSNEDRKALELAQNKQLLPYLIGELFNFYPDVKDLSSKKENGKIAFISNFVTSFAKVIEQKNKELFGGIKSRNEINKSIVKFYQDELEEADSEAISALIEKIKPFILETNEAKTKLSLVEKFKMQGLILTFSKLYEQAGLPADQKLTSLKTSYGDEVMKTLADYLTHEFSWAWSGTNPVPYHALLEREAARKAASTIYDRAMKVKGAPKDETKIQALYAALQEQRFNLQNKFLFFSVQHRNPYEVINTALTAVDSLHIITHCEQEFREKSHDTALVARHINQFRKRLDKITNSIKNEDNVWQHLEGTLKKIIEIDLHLMSELPQSPAQYKNSYIFIKKNDIQELYYIKPEGEYEKVKIDNFNLFEKNINAIKNKDETKLHLSEEQIKKIITDNGGHTLEINTNKTHLIEELYEAIERFSTYNAYLPYKNKLRALKEQLSESMTALQKADGLIQDNQENLFSSKAAQFARLLETNHINPLQKAEGIIQNNEENQVAKPPKIEVRIQSGCDSLQSYIEVQVKNSRPIEGFTGYQSTYLTGIDKEKTRITQYKEALARNKDALINVSDVEATKILYSPQKNEFEKLFRLKALLDQSWSAGLNEELTKEISKELHGQYEYIQKVTKWNFTSDKIDVSELEKLFGDDFALFSKNLIDEHMDLSKKLESIKNKLIDINKTIRSLEDELQLKRQALSAAKDKLTGILKVTPETMFLNTQILIIEGKLSEPQNKCQQLTKEESFCKEQLTKAALELNKKKGNIISTRETYAKLTLRSHISDTSKKLVDSLENDITKMDDSFTELEKAETQKSSYQTRRFANVTELLKYEASLVKEETNIPAAKIPAKRKFGGLFQSEPSKKGYIPVQQDDNVPNAGAVV